MINNETQKVKVIYYQSGTDAWGQKQTVEEKREDAEMFIKLNSITNIESPYYIDCDYIGLTKTKLSTVNKIIIGEKIYKVLRVITTKRFYEVFLKDETCDIW